MNTLVKFKPDTLDVRKIADDLERDGYARVPSFLPDVSDFRARCDRFFNGTDSSEMSASCLLADDYFSAVLIDPRLIDLYEHLFGDNPVLYPNVTVRKDVYAPWHIDRGFIKTHKHTRNLDFQAFQFGIYVQTNGEAKQGELEVRAGSHNILKRCPFDNTALIDIYTYLSAPAYPAVRLSNSEPGDLFIWDRRLFHRAAREIEATGDAKYAMYWSASSDEKIHEQHYLRHLSRRKNWQSNLAASHASEDRYDELSGLDVLESFNKRHQPRLAELVSSNKLRLGQL